MRNRVRSETARKSAPRRGPPSGRENENTGGAWDSAHIRVTFHCPRELLAALDAEVGRTADSKSRIIVDALAEQLGWKRPGNFP